MNLERQTGFMIHDKGLTIATGSHHAQALTSFKNSPVKQLKQNSINDLIVTAGSTRMVKKTATTIY